MGINELEHQTNFTCTFILPVFLEEGIGKEVKFEKIGFPEEQWTR
jgi:hypothetical protein